MSDEFKALREKMSFPLGISPNVKFPTKDRGQTASEIAPEPAQPQQSENVEN